MLASQFSKLDVHAFKCLKTLVYLRMLYEDIEMASLSESELVMSLIGKKVCHVHVK